MTIYDPYSKQEDFRSEARRRRYKAYWAAAQSFTPSLRTLIQQGPAGVADVTRGVSIPTCTLQQ